MISRRSILTGFAGLLAAPAVIRVATLMPISPFNTAFRADPIFPGSEELARIANELLAAIDQDERDRRVWVGQQMRYMHLLGASA